MRYTVIFSIALVAACANQAQRTPAGLSPAETAAQPRELLPDEQIEQVLNRLAFGPRPGDAEQVRAVGVDRWINQQLHPQQIADANTGALVAKYPVLSTNTGDIIRDYDVVQQLQRRVRAADKGDTTIKPAEIRRQILANNPQLADVVRKSQQLVGEVQSAKLARAVASDRQLDEVMTDFWENHFSVFAGKGQVRLFLAQYDRDVIRPHALGKFRDLLGAVAKSPAMLFFLDNAQSAADSTQPTLSARFAARGARPGVGARRGLNENYARELMELHTLGVDGGYTQQDVQEVARALTGWGFNRQTGAFLFNPNMHDAGAKTILGHAFPSGRGQAEGEEVLDILSRAPSTARFITSKLARRFVSDDPPKTLVDRCSNTFLHTDGDIRATVSCIVTSPEFFSRAAYRAKVKTPFEVVTSALRALNAYPDTTPRTALIVARLGQPIFGRQTPDGWPDRGDAWMNTGAILNRINLGLSIATGQVPGARPQQWVYFDSLRVLPRAQQVDGVVRYILGGQVSAETREVLMSGDNPMLSHATAKGVKGTTVDLGNLPQIIGLALGAPEFQRR